jgi:hypothetical protein
MTTLDELRRANLQEQRRKAEEASKAAAAAEKKPVEPRRSEPAPVAPIAPVEMEAPAAVPAPEVSNKAAAVETPSAAQAEPECPVPSRIENGASPLETPSSATAYVNGNGHAPAVEAMHEVEPTEMEAPISDEAEETAPIDEADRKARAILDRFYRGLAHKVVYPTGVKATVDMPPDLFWRVKRYCHDHNNVTVRQLFLDLVIAVLDEEGY